MSKCEVTDFMYPMKADLYYASIDQSEYGQPKKTWILDRTFICNASGFGRDIKEIEVKPAVFLQYQNQLMARSKEDLRVSSFLNNNAITNILVTNIRDAQDNPIYRETAGPRSGRSTIYEIAALEPIVGPFGNVEYYQMVFRKTENQTTGD